MATTSVTVSDVGFNQIIDLGAGTAADLTNGNHYLYSDFTGAIIVNTDGSAADLDVTITPVTGDSNNFIADATKTTATISDGHYAFISFLTNHFNTQNYGVVVTYNDASGTSTGATIIPIRAKHPVS